MLPPTINPRVVGAHKAAVAAAAQADSKGPVTAGKALATRLEPKVSIGGARAPPAGPPGAHIHCHLPAIAVFLELTGQQVGGFQGVRIASKVLVGLRAARWGGAVVGGGEKGGGGSTRFRSGQVLHPFNVWILEG